MSEADLKDAQVVFVLGGPGSGKGTQCAKLVTQYGFNHLSSGDLLRDEVAAGSPMGKEITAIMEKGELVPLNLVLNLLKQAMIKGISKNKAFLIDGYPRETEQGKEFEKVICECKCVINFDVSEETLRQRIMKRAETSGRADDNEETIIKRLKTFNEHTIPVIEYYHGKNKAVKIDGSRTVDEVYKDVCVNLEKFGVVKK